MGGSAAIALAFETVHFFGCGTCERQSGTFSPTSGDSLMATTEIPWLSSWFQYLGHAGADVRLRRGARPPGA